MLGPTIISAGFSHSAAINSKGILHVWGDNKNQQLTSQYNQSTIERPEEIKLLYKSQDYKARSVVCGPTFTFVIASNKQNSNIQLDEDELEILLPLRKLLLKKGTLAGFFGLIGKKRLKRQLQQQDQNYQLGLSMGMGQMHDFLNDSSDEDSEEDQYIKTQEAELFQVTRNQFIDSIERAMLTTKKNRIHFLADRLIEERKNPGETILLGDIEDYVLGFRQNVNKVFAFGQGHRKIFAFQKKLEMQESQSQLSNDESEEDYDQKQKALHKQYQSEIIVVSRPTAIKFPKHTRPIVQIACGSAHILAITENFELFSWGCGQYGALGFGTRDDIAEPRQLVIEKKDYVYIIVGVACGKYHSMCITKKKKILTWGTGQGGRLGHGDEEDVLVPKEIYDLSKKKIIFIAAGESHSAAISEKLNLYTWGTGTYGRLGHGMDTSERKPKLIEDLDQFEITHVSCGAFHTLVTTGQGTVYAFGQGKYGKLGINRKQREGVYSRPEKINFYRIGNEPQETLVQDKNEALIVAAGYNHSMCLTKYGKVYSWGYNGKGLLGRKKKFEEHLPLEIGQQPGEFQAKILNSDEVIQKGDLKQEELFSYEVIQVACGSLNTVSLTNGGEVYVFGSNAYGQLANHKDQTVFKRYKKQDQNGNDNSASVENQEQMSLIRFPGESTVRINFVACGGEHIFAISRMNELFGWGRNDEGQLGLGFVSDFTAEPTLIRDIAHKNIQMIACGDNYSAAVSAFGEVFVTGNLEGGKLGLGQALKKGFLLNFTLIQDMVPIKYVACGPNHMIAISEYNPDHYVKDGMCYAWGKNHKGQLGIGSREDANVPKKIINAKERFKKVACGYDFSLGLTYGNQVYAWGNCKYFCDSKTTKDVEVPILLQALEQAQIKDISCSYKFCSVLNDKGEILIWGSYLTDRLKKKQKTTIKSQTNLVIQKFPMRKFDHLMESISTGPNHSAAVSVKRSLYSWGHSDGGRLGVSDSEFKNAKIEPILVQLIHDLMQKNRQNLKEGRGAGDEEIKNLQYESIKPGIQEEQKVINYQEDRKIMDNNKILIQDDINIRKITEDKEEVKEKHVLDDNEDQEDNDEMDDLDETENHIIEDNRPQEKLNLISLARQQSLVESHMLLQKILKKERSDQLEENQILRFDDELMKEIDTLLTQFKQYQNLEKERDNILTQIESAFLTRITETPFTIQQKSTSFDQEANQKRFKNQVEQMLTIIQTHPCYMIRLYQSQIIQSKEYQILFKEIYSYQNERVNYLQMTVCQGILDYELKQYQSLEDVNFLSKNSVVGRIVKLIFKSQETNIDTLCSIACHIIKQNSFTNNILYSKLLNKYSSSSVNSQDNSFDVTEKLNTKLKQFDVDKIGKVRFFSIKKLLQINTLPKRAKDLFNFIEEVIRDLMENEVLYPSSSYFVPKKQLVEEMNFLKKQNSNSDNAPKLEALRFSPEISYLAELISKKLREIPSKGSVDDHINSKILSLIFGMIDKIWKNFDVYLFPYIKTIKGLSIIEDVINKTHFNNLENIFSVINCFFRNETAFPEFQQTDQWCKDFNLKLIHLQQSTKGLILTRIIDKNQMKQLSFKNFENLILHSLESEGHTITISNRSLGKLITIFRENPRQLSQVLPETNDPLYQVLFNLKDDVKPLLKSSKYDRQNFNLKTRLLIEEDNPIATRCSQCNAILIQTYAPPDSVSILERYNPEDSQSLVVQYCNILKQIQDISRTESISEYIEKVYQNAKRNSSFDLANKMLKFLNQVQQEYENIQTKNATNQQLNNQDQSEVKIKESIYLDIQRQAEAKINERRTRKYDLTIIQRRIHNVLKKKIQAKVKQIQEKELLLYKMTLYNIQYGLANHELKHLADAYTLKHMRKIIDFTTSAKMSKNLFKNLRNEQKLGLRAIVKKSAKGLIQNQTITNVRLQQLKPLINQCEFFFIEGENLSINIKLVFRQQQWSLCGPPKILSEAVLLNFSLSQKELLDMRKNIKNPEYKRLLLANSLEFDSHKLMKIFNEMDRSKSAYLLNSGATPLILQKSQGDSTNDNKI